jgi:predicted amidohydrolase
MKIGFLQFDPVLNDPEANIKKLRKMITAENSEYDLLVLPELSNSGYLFSDIGEVRNCAEEIPVGPFCTMLSELAAQKEVHFVAGICEKDGTEFFNSSILVRPDGFINTYRKTHLFNEEKKWFSPGDSGFEVHTITGKFGEAKIGMMICFDWIFPESARTLALRGAQIVCHPSNLVLSYCQNAMFTRAVENRVFTVTANRIGKEQNSGKELFFTGESVIVDTKGNYLARAGKDEECIVITEIDPRLANDKEVTPLNNIFSDRRPDMYFD